MLPQSWSRGPSRSRCGVLSLPWTPGLLCPVLRPQLRPGWTSFLRFKGGGAVPRLGTESKPQLRQHWILSPPPPPLGWGSHRCPHRQARSLIPCTRVGTPRWDIFKTFWCLKIFSSAFLLMYHLAGYRTPGCEGRCFVLPRFQSADEKAHASPILVGACFSPSLPAGEGSLLLPGARGPGAARPLLAGLRSSGPGGETACSFALRFPPHCFFSSSL